MLESLTIRKFQSHDNTILKFHKGVNAIVGETDTGKSSIVRVLRWLIDNRPSGDEFISIDKKNCSATLKIDGKRVRRIKGEKNLYKIDKKEFKAFGQSVPEEVSSLLNISNVNLQGQLDAPFLLSESSAEVARYFNKIVKLDVIDKSLKNISQRIREGRLGLARKESKKSDLLESIKEYDWLVNAGDKIKKLSIIEKSITKTNKQIYDIDQLINDIEDLEEKKENLRKFSGVKNEINNLIELSEVIDKEEEAYYSLLEIVQVVEDTEYNIRMLTKEGKEIRKQLEKLMPDVCPLCGQEVR